MLKKLLDQAVSNGGVVLVENGIMLYRVEGDVIWTGAAWVHPDHRRDGICTEMARKVAMIGYRLGLTWFMSKTMKIRPDVTAMYKKMGRTITTMDEHHLVWMDKISDLLERWPNEVE